MPLTTVSVLKIVEDPNEAQRLYESSIDELQRVAEEEFHGNKYIIRDLVPSDMPGITNNGWVETSGVVNTYATMTMGDGTSIADDTVMLIYAISSPTIDSIAAPDITTMRFTVGAALRAQVNLYDILLYNGNHKERMAYFMTPLIITKNQNVTIEEFVVTSNEAHQKVLYGLIAEKAGKLIEA